MPALHKTLVIRFSSIGDIVLATPLLRVLRARFPDGQIDFCTKKEYAELVRSNHNLNYTYEFDSAGGFEALRALKQRIREERYDLILDIHGSLRSRFVRAVRGAGEVLTIDKLLKERTALVKLKKNLYRGVVSVADRYIKPLKNIGVVNDGKGPELHIPDETLFSVSGRIATLHLNRFERVVGLCPGSRHFTKQWPADRYTALGLRFANEREGAILLFGGPSEAELCEGIARNINEGAGNVAAFNLAGTMTVLESAAAMEFCDVVVTNDSGLMHVAAAVRKKTIVVVGSTVKEFGFFPVGTGTVVFERNGLSCRPCSHIGRSSCPERHFRCMLETDVPAVSEALDRLLAQPKAD